MKVKIIENENLKKLEVDVNDFIEENPDYNIHDIKFYNKDNQGVVLISYEDKSVHPKMKTLTEYLSKE